MYRCCCIHQPASSFDPSGTRGLSFESLNSSGNKKSREFLLTNNKFCWFRSIVTWLCQLCFLKKSRSSSKEFLHFPSTQLKNSLYLSLLWFTLAGRRGRPKLTMTTESTKQKIIPGSSWKQKWICVRKKKNFQEFILPALSQSRLVYIWQSCFLIWNWITRENNIPNDDCTSAGAFVLTKQLDQWIKEVLNFKRNDWTR